MRYAVLAVLTVLAFPKTSYAINFHVLAEPGLLIPQGQVADYYKPSIIYGGGIQADMSGPHNMDFGIRAEVFYSDLRPKTTTPGVTNDFALMPLMGSLVASHDLGHNMTATVLGGLGYYRNDWTVGTQSHDSFYMAYQGGLEIDMSVMSGLAIGLQTRYHLVTGCAGEEDDSYVTGLLVIKMTHGHGSHAHH